MKMASPQDVFIKKTLNWEHCKACASWALIFL